MKFTISITKDIIDKSLTCGVSGLAPSTSAGEIQMSCAFAVAYNELIPMVYVETEMIYFHGRNRELLTAVHATKEQTRFIEAFDSMNKGNNYMYYPNEYEGRFYMNRYTLVGHWFNVEVPDEVIEYWYPDVQKAVDTIIASTSLKLV